MMCISIKSFSAFICLLFLCLSGCAQPNASGSKTKSGNVIHIEKPVPQPDGFAVYEKSGIHIAEGKLQKGKYSQTYSIDLSAGEHIHIVASAEQFNIGLMAELVKDNPARVGLIKDTAYVSGYSQATYDSVFSEERTLLFTISGESELKGDEMYNLKVVMANDSVRDFSKMDFCQKLSHLAHHSRSDYFMLRGKKIQSKATDRGVVDTYLSLYHGDEIECAPQLTPEYVTVLYTSTDVHEAKKELDQTVLDIKECFDLWNYPKQEYANFDEKLGKDFGAVSYRAQYIDDAGYTYVLTVALGKTPSGDMNVVILRLYLR